jgi:16S rRNA A1518/A1519 N6-dimethyltransferase RsmA/KsgA/DIM1 with predicted DNA glycosylase/AP lyase activity
VVGLFGFRRKQLLRGLRELTDLPAETVLRVLDQVGLGSTMRPQELTPGQFILLHSALSPLWPSHRT